MPKAAAAEDVAVAATRDTTEDEPATVAVKVYVPIPWPSVSVVDAIPVASVIALAGDTLPSPFTALKLIVAPITRLPLASIAWTASLVVSALPTIPDWLSPPRTLSVPTGLTFTVA